MRGTACFLVITLCYGRFLLTTCGIDLYEFYILMAYQDEINQIDLCSRVLQHVKADSHIFMYIYILYNNKEQKINLDLPEWLMKQNWDR